jgi:UrcA family protein
MSFSAAHADEAYQSNRYITAQTSIATIDVRYDDLNLSSPAGARVILNRIAFAAVKVCGGNPDPRDLVMIPVFKSCKQAATDDAVDQLGAPLVTSLYMQEYPTNARMAYDASREH